MTIDSLMSGLIGSLIGGLVTWVVAWRANARSEALAVTAAKQDCRNLLQSIYDEIEVVYTRYRDSFAMHVEALKAGEALLVTYPVFSDYFTVYNGNASRIGAIPDHDLRRAIIRTYTLSKGLVDSFRMNNYMIEQYTRAVELAAETKNEAHNALVHRNAEYLVEYAMTIKELHSEAYGEYQTLLRMLNKQGIIADRS